MKKLKLSIHQLEQAEVLTRAQLKNVLGGMTATISDYCGGWICTLHEPGQPMLECDLDQYQECSCRDSLGNGSICVFP